MWTLRGPDKTPLLVPVVLAQDCESCILGCLKQGPKYTVVSQPQLLDGILEVIVVASPCPTSIAC